MSPVVPVFGVEESSRNKMHSRMRFVIVPGAFILNVLVAVFGSALLERLEYPYLLHRLSWFLFKGFLFSFIFALVLGFAVQKLDRTGTAKWVWTATTAIFIVAVILYTSRTWAVSADHLYLQRIWDHFGGAECEATLNASGCLDVFIYTSTLVRGIAYSSGAYLAQESAWSWRRK